jgi:hypothetical protein
MGRDALNATKLQDNKLFQLVQIYSLWNQYTDWRTEGLKALRKLWHKSSIQSSCW